MPLSVLLASIFIIDRNSLTRYLSQYLLPVYNTYNRHSTGLSTVIIKSYQHITPTSQHFSCGLFGIYPHDLLILYC